MKTDVESKAVHTPGPWKWEQEDSFREQLVTRPRVDYGWSDDGPNLVTVDGEHDVLSSWGHDAWGVWVREADAKLIAAAPDLYDALENITALVEAMADDFFSQSEQDKAVQQARAALSKACAR